MIDITFKINGRVIRPNQVGNAREEEALKTIENEITKKVGNLHDSQTDERLKILVKGRDINDLTLEISGSEQLVEQAIKALQ
jgi:hypothetical protein